MAATLRPSRGISAASTPYGAGSAHRGDLSPTSLALCECLLNLPPQSGIQINKLNTHGSILAPIPFASRRQGLLGRFGNPDNE